MKKIITLFVVLLSGGMLIAQNSSIHLVKPDWKKVVSQAAREGKFIFVDCNTSWCGPCKVLAQKVFTIDSVADYFNTHFVSVSYDVEKHPRPPFEAMPEIRAFPTLWFIDPESLQPVYGYTGAPDAGKLMQLARAARDPEQNFPGMKSRLQANSKDTTLFFTYYKALKDFRWWQEYIPLGEVYINTLPIEEFTKLRNWELFENQVNDGMNPIFQRICGIQELLKKEIGEERVEHKINPNLNWIVQGVVGWSHAGNRKSDSLYAAVRDFVSTVEWKQKDWMMRVLKADGAARKGDFTGMMDELQGILERYGSDSKETEWAMGCFLRKLLESGSREQLEKGVEYIDLVLKENDENITTRQLREALMKAVKNK